MLNPRWNKVLNDLWENKSRTLLIVLAIAVGVFAFGSTFITREVVSASMNDAYAATSPATIQIGGWFDDAAVRAVEDMPSVEAVEGWASFYLKMQVNDRWWNIDLYGVRDFTEMRVNRIEPVEGDWPPDTREIWFERSTVPVVGAQIGDLILVELPDGSRRELVFAGVVHDLNTVPPNLSLWPTGFASLETLHWLGQQEGYSRLSIATDPSLTEMTEIEEVAADITDRLERYGYGVGGSYSQRPNEHWATEPFQAFVTILSGIGVLALLLSGFLVVNTVTSVCNQQKRQIGMMKTVGATGGQIMGVYLTMVCTFGLLSLLVAVPVGMGIAYLSAQFVGAFLNIDFVDFWLPPWVLGLEVGTALAVPVLASLIPILAGTRTTVREAVSDYGINSLLKSGLLDRALMRIRRLPRPTLLSLRNTVRRKGRLFLTLGTLTLAGTIFTGVLNVRASLMRELDAVMRLYGFDIQMYLDNSAGILQLEREALRVPGVEHAEGWTFARAERIRPDDTEGSTFTILGPPADTPFIEPTLLEGRWLEPGDQNAIVLGSDLLKDEPDIHVGDEIMLEINEARRRWQVVGIINTGLESGVAYADYGYLSHVVGMPGRSWVLFAGTAQHDQAFQAEAARALEERLKRSGIDVSQSLTLGEIIGANVGQFNFLIGFMMFMAILLAIVGGLGLTSTMSLNVLERTREIGVMRATGASNRAVRGVVVTEGTVIGFLSWMLAAPLSVPLGAGMCAAVGAALFERPMPLSFSVAGVWIWLAIVLIISTLASLVPAARAARISVREALAYE